MRLLIPAFAALALSATAQRTPITLQGPSIQPVYTNDNFQMTGVTVSRSGRLFVNYPRWSDRYLDAVEEVLPDGTTRPFPNLAWNRWDRKQATAGQAFVCVQSVVVDDQDRFWALDPAAPMLGPVVQGGPKLVQIDLQTNQVVRTIPFGPDVALPNSYLNDIRFDTGRGFAYITDSGVGGLVVVDLTAGTARRVLDGDPSTLVQPGVDIVVNNRPVRDQNGQIPQFNADSIALSPDRAYLYYKPLTGATLSRIRTSVLQDASQPPTNVYAAVETVAQLFPTDGILFDPQGRLYLSGVNQNAIFRRTPDGRVEYVVGDPRIQWPDTFAQGPDGTVYFTTSRIHETPPYNGGRDARTGPFAVYKIVQ